MSSNSGIADLNIRVTTLESSLGPTGATGATGVTGVTGPSPTYSQPVYGSANATFTGGITATTSGTAVTIMSAAIPSSGVWEISAQVNCTLSASQLCVFALFDGSGLVLNTEGSAGYIGPLTSFQGQGSSTWIVTTAGPVNYTVRAWGPGSTTGCQIDNDAEGRSFLVWRQLSGGYIGATGATGVTGVTGADGVTGPTGVFDVSGIDPNSVLFYDGNAILGSPLLTFDGATLSSQNTSVTNLSISKSLQDSTTSYGSIGQYLGLTASLESGTPEVLWQDFPSISGTTGPTGPAGANGQSSSYFFYRADTGLGNPATGHISWEEDPQLDSSYIRVHHISQDGVDIDIFLNLVQEGNTLIIQDKNVSANFQQWLVSGSPIPNTGSNYVQYPVSLISSGGDPEFENNHALILATIVPGPQGPTGTFEFSGPTGSVLYYDGSGVTGNAGFLWTETGGEEAIAYRLTGGLNGNCIDLDDDANMSINLGLTSQSKVIAINASSSIINLQDRSAGEGVTDSQISITSDDLYISVAGTNGSAGQYLGSNSSGKVTWSVPPPSQVYQATYSKSAQQNLTSPETDVTFDETESWNNPGTYIAQTAPTDFTVGITGLYQMEFNANIIGVGSTWVSLNKTISIDITRSPETEVIAIQQSASISSGANYSQSLCCTFKLEVGDVINCRISNAFTAGTPYARGVTNTFDLNTFFTWRFIS